MFSEFFSKFIRKEEENISNILRNTQTLKYKMIGYSVVVGTISGLVVCSYRIFGDRMFNLFKHMVTNSEHTPIKILFMFFVLILMALFVAQCVKAEPNISGSGIPQVEGTVTRRMQPNWKKVLIFKYIGGLVSLAAGLSVGREGPSVQIGASVGEGISKKTNKMDYEHKYLITSGAAAGLAAAFNAPLAGVMFALEEVHKNFSPIVLMSAMVASLTSDAVTKVFIGFEPALWFKTLQVMPIRYYWSLILLGIIIGCSSWIFNNGILKSKRIYRALPLKIEFKILIPFIMAGVIALCCPIMLGGGHTLIVSIYKMNFGILMLLILVAVKYLFTFVSFGSGVPGGIFFPLLAIGSLLGTAVGMFCIKYLHIPAHYLINFAVFAMAGSFGAIVKAPITGIVLVFEMTGSLEHLLPLALVVFVAMIVSDLLGVHPIYDDLLEDILDNGKHEYKGDKDKKTLVELTVCLESMVDGKTLSQVKWPDNCLVVSIDRGDNEIIPRGNTRMLEGDRLTIMVNQTDSARMLDTLTQMISVEKTYY